jgi:type II secretory pathway predicted ATPase ExeA
MKSHTTSDTEIWLAVDEKLVRVADHQSHTIGVSSKRTFSITVIDKPMNEALETVKRQLLDPNSAKRVQQARQIFQSIQSLQTQIIHGQFTEH